MNSTIRCKYSNTVYVILNSLQHFEKKTTKIHIFVSYNTHVVSKIYETIQTDIWTGIQIPEFGVPKKPNTEYYFVFR